MMFKKIACICLTLITANVLSNTSPIEAVPSSWHLQNYIGDFVHVYHTGSPCVHGKLNFGDNASIDEKNRFWSLIMAAKVSKSPVQVFFDSSGAPDNCIITSFGFPPN